EISRSKRRLEVNRRGYLPRLPHHEPQIDGSSDSREVCSQLRSHLVARLRCRNEILHHRFAHQVWRQQALAKNEVVEFLLVEFRTERGLGVLSELQQFRVPVEIGVRLAGHTEGVTLDFLIGKRNREATVHRERFHYVRWLHFARLQFGIREGANGSQQP